MAWEARSSATCIDVITSASFFSTKLSLFPISASCFSASCRFSHYVGFLDCGRGLIRSMLALLLKRTARVNAPCASAYVTTTDVTLLLSSFKLTFFTNMAEIHRLGITTRAQEISLSAYRTSLILNSPFNAMPTASLKVEGWTRKNSVLVTLVSRPSIKLSLRPSLEEDSPA